MSNQALGGMGGGTGNLGEPRYVNFASLGGNQYFTVAAPVGPVLGDLDGDGHVGPTDLAILLGAWGTSCTIGCPADLNTDGVVDASDLAILLGAWG